MESEAMATMTGTGTPQQQQELPDPTALEIVASADNEEECQRLILRVLDYGTTNNNDDNGNDNDISLLSKRTKETIQWLESSIAVVVESSSSSSASAFELIEDVLVDCLWLCGSKSISLPWTTTAEQKFHPTVQALIEITRALLLLWKIEQTQLARKLQENWFPVLLEAVNLVNSNVDVGGSANANASSNANGTTLLGNADDLMKRLKQYNTITNYKQQKYNLLQEESEGYSKILQYLCHHSCSGGSDANDDNDDDDDDDDSDDKKKLTYLWQLVGTFELDPSRVIDLCLDVLESKLFGGKKMNGSSNNEIVDVVANSLPKNTKEIRWLLDVISECSSDKIPALMRFKIENINKNNATTNHSSPSSSSSSLLKSVAFLVHENIMDLRTFMEDYFEPTLGPNIDIAYEIYRKKERGRVVALSRVSLSGNNGSKEDPKQIELANKLKLAMGTLKLNNDVDKDNGNDSNNDTTTTIGSNGQILSLLLVLIRWGEWELVKPMLSSSLWSKLCCLMPESFGSAFLDVTEERIKVDPTTSTPKLNKGITNNTASLSHENDSDNVSAILGLVRAVRSISDPLSCVIQSGSISSRPVLFCHICRHLRALLTDVIHEENDTSGNINAIDSVPNEVFSFLDTFLVPSLSLFPSNPAISTELFSVLKILSYEIRYKLYEGWEGSGLEKAGLFGGATGGTKPLPNVESEMVAGKAVRYALKRLSKDNIRDMSRQLAKTTHSHPLVVYATILSQIESYDNMVEVMVEAQRFVNPLGLDVLSYCMLGRLSGTSGGVNRSRLKGMKHEYELSKHRYHKNVSFALLLSLSLSLSVLFERRFGIFMNDPSMLVDIPTKQ
jgi:THO complex subunit 2